MNKVDFTFFYVEASSALTRLLYDAKEHVSDINNQPVLLRHEHINTLKVTAEILKSIFIDQFFRCKRKGIKTIRTDNDAIDIS